MRHAPLSHLRPGPPPAPTARAAVAVTVAAVAALIGAGACFEPGSSQCAWGGVCPPGMRCHDATQECLYPVQLTACRTKPDKTPCSVPGQTAMYLCRDALCQLSRCGDGLVDERPEVGEACDDGNTQGGDGCRADCLGEERCGDSLVDEAAGEECDDGNANETDGCTSRCRFPYCGDGLVTGGEACDCGTDASHLPMGCSSENSDTTPDACRTSCRRPACGDGVKDSGERGQCWSLQAAGRQDTGAHPVALETGDLDGDGRPDVAVAAQDASAVAVFLADAHGGLRPLTSGPLALGEPAGGVALGDVDGDDALDVVAVGRAGAVVWYPGDGAGGFGPGLRTAVPTARYTAVATADLDGDGAAEILAVDDAEDTLWVFSAATGLAATLQSARSVGAPGYAPVRLAVADANGDGRPEVAIANFDFAQLSLFTTTPAGLLEMVPGFPWPVGESWGSTASDVAFADADGDGNLDLVFVDARFWEPSRLGALLGDGQLGFAPAPGAPFVVGEGVFRLAAGDLDGDGRTDLVLPSSLTGTTLVLFSGLEAASDPALWVAMELQARGMAVGLADTDGDGNLDLLLGDQAAGYVDLYRNTP